MSVPPNPNMDDVVEELRQLEPGILPLPLFLEVSRLSVSAIVEFVPLRDTPQGLETLLFRRSQDDPLWPGQWANPGTVLRPTDTPGSIDDAMARIVDDDFEGVSLAIEPSFADNLFFKTKRGMHFAAVYWQHIEDSSVGTFFPVDNLPDDIVTSQIEVIEVAVKAFQNEQRQ